LKDWLKAQARLAGFSRNGSFFLGHHFVRRQELIRTLFGFGGTVHRLRLLLAHPIAVEIPPVFGGRCIL
jgi:hypothetical protein